MSFMFGFGRFLSSTLFIFGLLFGTNAKLIRWAPVVDGKWPTDAYYSASQMDSNGDTVVDLSGNYQAIVKVDTRTGGFPKFKIACKVERTHETSQLLSAHFCKDGLPPSAESTCKDITVNRVVNFGHNNKFRVEYTKLDGAMLYTNWNAMDKIDENVDLSGIYYCRFANDFNTLTSAALEIQDVMFKYRGIPRYEDIKLKEMDTISAMNLPLKIACPRINLGYLQPEDKHNVKPLFRWYVVTIDGNDTSTSWIAEQLTFQSTYLNNVEQYFDSETMADGTLLIFSISPERNAKIGALICVHAIDASRVFGIIGDKKSTSNSVEPIKVNSYITYNGPPQLMEPAKERQQITIRAGLRSLRYPLEVLYRHGTQNLVVRWYKDGVQLRSTQSKSKLRFQYLLGHVKSKNMFEITDEMSGRYEVLINYEDETDVLRVTYDVEVRSPPRVVLGGDPVEYCMEHGNFSSQMQMNGASQQDFFLNGSPAGSFGGKLRYQLQPPDLAPDSIITYSLTNVSKGGSHMVTLEARSDVGICRINKFINVVPLPDYELYTEAYPCRGLDCKPGEMKRFWCRLKRHSLSSIEETGAIVTVDWFVGNEKITKSPNNSSYLKYFVIGDGFLQLMVKVDNLPAYKKAKDMLRSTTVRCTVKIYDPQYYPPGGPVSGYLYSSNDDSRVMQRLGTVLDMQFEDVASGGFVWLYVIIVVILLLLVVVFIIIWTVTRFSSGQTYYVDQYERAQGHDPVKEIFEKEHFHTYERVDEDSPMLEGSQMDARSIGLDSDHGNELEFYELDPGKFNEDGSFIYKYS